MGYAFQLLNFGIEGIEDLHFFRKQQKNNVSTVYAHLQKQLGKIFRFLVNYRTFSKICRNIQIFSSNIDLILRNKRDLVINIFLGVRSHTIRFRKAFYLISNFLACQLIPLPILEQLWLQESVCMILSPPRVTLRTYKVGL